MSKEYGDDYEDSAIFMAMQDHEKSIIEERIEDSFRYNELRFEEDSETESGE